MTAKFDKFKEALIALCEEHDVYIESDWIEEAITIKNGDQQGGVGKLVDFTMVQPLQPAPTPPWQPPHQIT